MEKFRYEFETEKGKTRLTGELWAWKWGHWQLTPKWTSESTPDADFDTANAKKGFEGFGQSLLMLAIPSGVMTAFGKQAAFDKVTVSTFGKNDPPGTPPKRTAVYFTANVVDAPILKDFSKIPYAKSSANYLEVLLRIENGVEVV